MTDNNLRQRRKDWDREKAERPDAAPPKGGTTVREALWQLLSEAKCPDGFPEANNEERANYIAPKIEAALRAAYDRGYDDARKGVFCRHNDNGVTAGITKLEEK